MHARALVGGASSALHNIRNYTLLYAFACNANDETPRVHGISRRSHGELCYLAFSGRAGKAGNNGSKLLPQLRPCMLSDRSARSPSAGLSAINRPYAAPRIAVCEQKGSPSSSLVYHLQARARARERERERERERTCERMCPGSRGYPGFTVRHQHHPRSWPSQDV